jgi:homospermidine synthase
MADACLDWTSLADQGRGFPENVDATDLWQFRNVQLLQGPIRRDAI